MPDSVGFGCGFGIRHIPRQYTANLYNTDQQLSGNSQKPAEAGLSEGTAFGNRWCLGVSPVVIWTVVNKELSYRRDSARCVKRPFKVIHCCANRHGMGLYDFLLALNSNLTSIFNRCWDITPSMHIITPPLFQVELEKDGWEYVDMLWCKGAQDIELSNHKLKSALMCTVWS